MIDAKTIEAEAEDLALELFPVLWVENFNGFSQDVNYPRRLSAKSNIIGGMSRMAELLAKQSTEFDEKSAKRFWTHEGLDKWRNESEICVHGAKKQHQKTSLIYEAKLAIAVESITKALDQLEVFNFAKDPARVALADTELRNALEKLGAK
jgi:hypothetical protein